MIGDSEIFPVTNDIHYRRIKIFWFHYSSNIIKLFLSILIDKLWFNLSLFKFYIILVQDIF